MNQALARKWRPKTFAELVGQEHVVQALTNSLGTQRLHHAYLFTGTRGVGKTTLARILAKAFNCEQGVSATPCGTCSACTGIDAGRFVDLLEVDAASNTQVDKMRELLENALYAPTAGRYKIYVIDEVHQLSGHSFNAMLKTLEEPPEHVKFVLATTDPQKVPVTVLSRCLQFNLRQIPAEQIRARLAEILQSESVAFEPAAIAVLARAARGSLRDALSLLDQAIAHGGGQVDEASVSAMLGLAGHEHLYNVLQSLAAGDGKAMLAQADAMAAHGIAFEQALQELASLWHRIAVAQIVPAALSADDADQPMVQDLAGRFSPEEVQLCYQITNQGRADIVLAPDEYAGFTMTLLRMLAFAPEGATRAAIPAAMAASGAGGERRTAPAAPAAAAPTPQAKGAKAVDSPSKADAASARIADWAGLLGALRLSGMARQLAHNCELVGESGDVLELRVAAAHKHLLEKGPQERLRAAIEEHLGRSIRLKIEVGDPVGHTPAQLDEQERRSRLESATQALNADPFVRELVDGFGAQVVPDSIKPQR
ncbi:MAG: DNA polymerase III subunit gamma/tau [Betaproteobacteria bacterium]|nr:MAG: DNA polymerase III subunit gamma/tau [Betaproteobacteria bacterium]